MAFSISENSDFHGSAQLTGLTRPPHPSAWRASPAATNPSISVAWRLAAPIEATWYRNGKSHPE